MPDLPPPDPGQAADRDYAARSLPGVLAVIARVAGLEAALAVGFTPFLIGAAVKSALMLASRWGLLKLWPALRLRS